MTAGWIPMMAAMMLPSALPAVARRARDHDGVLAAPLFAGLYAGVWVLVGLAVYALYQPPGELVADALIVAGAGPMSAAWMVAIAVVVLGQKLLPPKRVIDVPLALALVALALI